MSATESIDRPGIYEILRRYWGYRSFLPLQEESIASILAGRDSLTKLPTGGGKSLCFQLPVLLKEGMAVIVSPLISLMKDQVDSLKDLGISAAYLNSSLSFEAKKRVMDQAREGGIKLLYIAPERLVNDETMKLLRSTTLSFFVIDEAHCISHWGHDFRADYRNLWLIKETFRPLSVHAFTATATQEVQRDILDQLRLTDAEIHLGTVDRPNLTYRVMQRKQILKQVTELLRKHDNDPGIIYCLRRKDVDSLSLGLRDLGFDNVPYHAGMTAEERRINQEKFAREEVDIVVATVAFGMGIDRSNVRFVIHAGMPRSVEHYQQETGRAGRDGLPAFCYMFYGGADYQLWNFFAERSSERTVMMKKLGSMYNFCAQPQCRHKVLAGYFGQRYEKASCDACDYCLNELDMVDDPLVVGQKILSCVARVHENSYGFGAAHVANILKGNLTEKIENMRHHELSTFGIMAGESVAFSRYMIEQLIGQGFLSREGEYSTLSVTGPGRGLLKGEHSPVLAKPLIAARKKEVAKKSLEKKREEWDGVDYGLFQKLRAKRTELALKKAVPAYIIFSDNSLKDMALKKPVTRDVFSGIYGVGKSKLKKYADIFIEVIKGET